LTFIDSKHQIIKYIIKSLTNHLKVELIINSKFYKFNESLKDLFKQRLNKSVNNYLLIEHKVYLNLIVLIQIVNVVIKDIDVL